MGAGGRECSERSLLDTYTTYQSIISSGKKKKENGGRTPPLSLPVFSVQGDSPGKNTRVECQALLQGIFPT